MAFITGLLLVDAPASALNNLGQIPGERDENTTGVKLIRTREGAYPYVSAQAFRYWLRDTLERTQPEWRSAPIYREAKVAYTDANPVEWWDDDLFGYMRAPGAGAAAKRARAADPAYEKLTPLDIKEGREQAVTRVSPFRVSTLVSIAPVQITEDFGVMARHDGDPVPYVHQFYRTTLQGLFSLDLHAAGTFSYVQRSGYRNLDEERIRLAKERGLDELKNAKSYRLPLDVRLKRISALVDGIAQLEGGAKMAVHYTDVSPVVTMLAVTKGGNHVFGHVFGATTRGKPTIQLDALQEVLSVFEREIMSRIYVGWVTGYCDEERGKLAAFSEEPARQGKIAISHPRQAFQQLIAELSDAGNHAWMG